MRSTIDEFDDSIEDFKPGNYLKLSLKYFEMISVRVAKSIDEKMDDGVFNIGTICTLHAECIEGETFDGQKFCSDTEDFGLSYDDAMKEKIGLLMKCCLDWTCKNLLQYHFYNFILNFGFSSC